MSTTVVTPPAETTEFDVAAYIAEQNAKEETARLAKLTPPIPTKVEEPKKEDPPAEAKVEEAEVETPKVEEPPKTDKPEPRKSNIHDRHFRRMLRDNAFELGKERALREQLEARLADLEKKKGGDPAVATPTDPEPQRADYEDEATYIRAAGRWDARQEARAQIAEANKQQAAVRSQEQYMARVAAMDAKAEEDRDIFEDWDTVAKEAERVGILKTPASQTLSMLFETSNVRSPVLYYLAKNPKMAERLYAFAESPDGQAEQIQEFRRIEGRAETLYNREAKKQERAESAKPEPVKEVVKEPEPPKVVKPTAAELDAKKAQPTSAITPRGGSAPPNTPSPFMEDGVTANPAWIAWRNDQSRR